MLPLEYLPELVLSREQNVDTRLFAKRDELTHRIKKIKQELAERYADDSEYHRHKKNAEELEKGLLLIQENSNLPEVESILRRAFHEECSLVARTKRGLLEMELDQFTQEWLEIDQELTARQKVMVS